MINLIYIYTAPQEEAKIIYNIELDPIRSKINIFDKYHPSCKVIYPHRYLCRMSIETKAIPIMSIIRLMPTRLDKIMANCRRGRVTILSTCPKTYGIGHISLLGTDEAIATHTCPRLMKYGRYMTGHRRGERHPLHQYIYPIGHINMAIVP